MTAKHGDYVDSEPVGITRRLCIACNNMYLEELNYSPDQEPAEIVSTADCDNPLVGLSLSFIESRD